MARALFAAGCFWHVEAVFQAIPGVTQVTSGYTGGHTADPTYTAVCGGDTGHAEAVEVWFDESLVSYASLLDTFWEIHDPSQVNRQGPDIGHQYRSAIFTCNAEQAELAQIAKTRISQERGITVATEITPAMDFYPAEVYHQNYYAKQGISLKKPK